MYTLTEKLIIKEDQTEIITYGIKNDSEKYDSISNDKDEVKELCRKFNNMDLDSLHFKDAVEDFIVGKAFCIHSEK